jgi:hypothetical protein
MNLISRNPEIIINGCKMERLSHRLCALLEIRRWRPLTRRERDEFAALCDVGHFKDEEAGR